MSTKIYNGYKLSIRNATLASLREFFAPIQAKVKKQCNASVATTLAEMCAEILDQRSIAESGGLSYHQRFSRHQAYVGGKSVDVWESPLVQAHIILSDAYIKSKREGTRSPDFDFEFEVCFIPCGKATLALLYTEKEEFRKIWERHPKVRDYHYQNQTDRPRNVTAEQWRRRAKDWDVALLDKGGLPASAGFTMSTFGYYGLPYPHAADVIKHIPSFEKRVQSIANDAVLEQKSLQLREAGEEMFASVMEAQRWIKRTDEGKAAVQKASIEVAGKLKKTLVKEDLLSTGVKPNGTDYQI
jgi:hypothetical protein